MPRVLTTALPEVILSIRGAHDADLLKAHDVTEVLSLAGPVPPECTCHSAALALEGRQPEDVLLDGCRLLQEALQAILQHRNCASEQAAVDEEPGDSSDEDGEGIRLRVRVSRGAGEMWGITWHAHIFKTSQRLVVKDVAEGSVLAKWNSGRAEHLQVGYGDRLIRINGVRADDYPPPEAATKMRAELKHESIRAVFWRPGVASENVVNTTLHKVLMCAETEDDLSLAATILAVWLIREQGVTSLHALEELLGEAWVLLQGKAAALRLLEANGCEIGEALQQAGDECKDKAGIREMKVIFLDLDGVLVTKDYHVFDEQPLRNLQRLVALTGAKIVLSSDWRQDESAKCLAEQQLAAAGLSVYSSTPVMPAHPEQRPSEVLQWLRDNSQQVSSWVVLDDRHLLSECDGDSLIGHFVQTDATVGLTDANLDEACHILLEAADSTLPSADSGQPLCNEAPVPSGVYGCVRCRTPLFRESRIQPHFTEGARKASRQWASHESGCTSVFVEPMPWMGELANQTGRLVCANQKCGQKLGSYSWHGLPCSCGQWQSPAFQVHLARVELMPGFKPHS